MDGLKEIHPQSSYRTVTVPLGAQCLTEHSLSEARLAVSGLSAQNKFNASD